MSNYAIDTKKTVKISLAAVGLLLILLILMGTVFKISGAVIAPGDVSVESRVKELTHPTGGVIYQVNVKNGQRVKKGDLLIRLDTSVSGISSSATGESLQDIMARKMRLEAERDGASSFNSTLDQSTGYSRTALSKEKMLFDLRQRSLEESHAQMRERLIQAEQESISIEAQIKSIDAQRQLIEKERKGVQELYNKGYVTITRYNQTERTALDLEAQADGLRARLAQSRARLAEIQQQDSQIDKDFRSEAGNELASLNAQMGDMQSRAASTADQHRRNEIRAPYDGIIDKLAFTTVGAFLPASQVILEIVPESDRNLIEVRIQPQDIDQIKIGQNATLHFSAFNLQTTPTVPGQVEWISAEKSTDQATGMTYYQAHIGVREKDFKRLDGLEVKIGMPVEAYIETGSRTILSYLLKPLIDQMNRAFR
jgi:HlyD family secretion protein